MSENPFRPGAGHSPPVLAGREAELADLARLLSQTVILENAVVTGLRGMGKTALLDAFKPLAEGEGWRWAGTDITEEASFDEERLATRILADCALAASGIPVSLPGDPVVGFLGADGSAGRPLGCAHLQSVYDATPGLVSDKLAAALRFLWSAASHAVRGFVLVYDEAQNLSDHAERNAFPLALLLNVLQRIQREGLPFLLVLSGLPTLVPGLVASRTYAERMFHEVRLRRLDAAAVREAVIGPLAGTGIDFSAETVDTIVEMSAGYPCFVQYVARDMFEVRLREKCGTSSGVLPREEILRRLDSDFFQGRWANLTDRQRDLLRVVAEMDSCEKGFSAREAAKQSGKLLVRAFRTAQAGQVLEALSRRGMLVRTDEGLFAIALPLLAQFVRRRPL